MVPDEFDTMEEIVDSFNMGKDKESEGCFDQSDTAARGCIEKIREKYEMTDKQILAHIGHQTDTSMTTMWGRLLVGRVFPQHWREADENFWCQSKRWSHFEVCARQWSEDDPEAPIEWLKYCCENDLSVRRLKSEIELANGGPPPQERPVYLLDATPCYIEKMYRGGLALRFEQELEEMWSSVVGTRVIVTIVKEPELVAVPA